MPVFQHPLREAWRLQADADDVVLLLCHLHYGLDGDVPFERISDDLLDDGLLGLGVVALVADDEEVALLAPLLPAVDRGVRGCPVGHEIIGLTPGFTSATEDELGEPQVHLVARLELPNLQGVRIPVCIGLSDEEDLRILDDTLCEQDAHQLG